MSQADREIRRFSVHDLRRMVEAGVLREDESVELIDGVLVTMSPQGPTHRSLSSLLQMALARAWPDDAHTQAHSPIHAGDFDEPEPDVAVVRGHPRDYLEQHPTGPDCILVVEVSVSSHREDRAKARTYAEAGVPVYWWLDVPDRRLTVFTEPRDGEYALIQTYRDPDRVPLPGLTTTLPVASLLP